MVCGACEGSRIRLAPRAPCLPAWEACCCWHGCRTGPAFYHPCWSHTVSRCWIFTAGVVVSPNRAWSSQGPAGDRSAHRVWGCTGIGAGALVETKTLAFQVVHTCVPRFLLRTSKWCLWLAWRLRLVERLVRVYHWTDTFPLIKP